MSDRHATVTDALKRLSPETKLLCLYCSFTNGSGLVVRTAAEELAILKDVADFDRGEVELMVSNDPDMVYAGPSRQRRVVLRGHSVLYREDLPVKKL